MVLSNPAKVLKDVIKAMVQDTMTVAANHTDQVVPEEHPLACMDPVAPVAQM